VTTERVGPYEIISVLGQGGMGVVYLAQQREPIERKVALKVVKSASDHQVRARFEAERRALARLNHPNVATVFDSGTDELGSPYIAMEHVPGQQITTFCDQQRATIGERIEVFIDVCKGVQHVHQKGLIHRDLKPANILVIDQDGSWIPKIIDFGIAKGFVNPLSEENLTRGHMIGTPMYVAPEALRGQDQDTRVDVYALGLVLYRLMIGVKPVPAAIADNFVAMLDGLATGAAIPPLTQRFRQLNAHQRERVGRERGIPERALERAFSQDLDWIAMKAIHPDPDQRYDTPKDLANDLRRFLEGQPVRARPPSLAYTSAKALRKHRWLAASGALLLLSMTAGIVSTGYQAREARHQAQRAVTAAELAESRRLEADEQRLEAEQVSNLLGEMFSSANPYDGGARDATVQELLDRALETLPNRDLPPAVHAKLLRELSRAYEGLGRYRDAADALAQAIPMLEKGENQNLYVRSLASLANLEFELGDVDVAVARAHRSLEIADAIGARPQDRTYAYMVLGNAAKRLGNMDDAVAYAEKSVAAAEAANNERLIASCLNVLAEMEMERTQPERAVTHLNRALEQFEEETNDVLHVTTMNLLGRAQYETGDREQGLATIREALTTYEERLGPEHATTRSSRLGLANRYARDGQFDPAKALFGQLATSVGGDASSRVLARLALGDIAAGVGEFAKAEVRYRAALSEDTDVLGPVRTLAAQRRLAVAISSLGRTTEAEELYKQGIGDAREAYGTSHPQVGASHDALAVFYEAQGRTLEAAAQFALVAGITETSSGPEHPDTIQTRIRAGRAFVQAGDFARAEAELDLAWAVWDAIEDIVSQKELLATLIAVYERTDRAGEASKLEARLAELDAM